MSDESEKRGRFPWYLLLIVLTVLYVLSFGPVGAVCGRPSVDYEGLLGHSARIIYTPLFWLTDITGMQEHLNKYVSWWNTVIP